MGRLQEVNPGKSADGRGGRVENADEQEGPKGAPSRGLNVLDRIKTYDDMRQSGCSGHQCKGDRENVDHALFPGDKRAGIFGQTQLRMNLVERIK